MVLCVTLAASAAYAAPPARTMYNDALAREKTVRTALSNPDAPVSVLPDVRSVVAAYEAVVKRHSTSGYSDNALWQAGTLALDAFAKFRQQQDRDSGMRLLRKLATVYVNSSLASKVRAALARAGANPAPPPGDEARSTDAETGTAGVEAATAGSIAPAGEERELWHTGEARLLLRRDDRTARDVVIEERTQPLEERALERLRNIAAAGGPFVQRVLRLSDDRRVLRRSSTRAAPRP